MNCSLKKRRSNKLEFHKSWNQVYYTSFLRWNVSQHNHYNCRLITTVPHHNTNNCWGEHCSFQIMLEIYVLSIRTKIQFYFRISRKKKWFISKICLDHTLLSRTVLLGYWKKNGCIFPVIRLLVLLQTSFSEASSKII